MRRFMMIAVACAAVLLVAAACGDDSGEEASDTPADGNGAEPTQEAGFQGRDPAVAFADVCQPAAETQFAQPEVVIDPARTYVATISTAKGDIVVQLYSDTPITTNNFVFLACRGFYDGLTFHRVVDNFVIQGGDPTGTGSGGPGYAIPDEDDGDHTMVEAVISMAKSGPNTTGSQYFITIGLGDGGDLSYLDPDFTVFGEVTSGMDVSQQIAQGDVMNTVSVVEQ